MKKCGIRKELEIKTSELKRSNWIRNRNLKKDLLDTSLSLGLHLTNKKHYLHDKQDAKIIGGQSHDYLRLLNKTNRIFWLEQITYFY